MAAVAELSLLLFAFISSIHAEEPITILEEKASYTVSLPKDGSSCLIFRFVDEQRFVLWNTSEFWSGNTTVPEDLKPLVDRVNISSNTIHNLTHSDSGSYRVECWNNGTMTHEKNISVTVCSVKHKMRSVQGKFGETVDLLCEGAADSVTVQWLKRHYRYEQEKEWTRVSSESKTQMDNEEGRLQVVKNTFTLHVSNFNMDVFGPYTCLVMDKQRCISSHPVSVIIQSGIIYRSVGEKAVLHCTADNLSDDQRATWIDPSSKTLPVKSPQNVSDSFGNFTEPQQNVIQEIDQNNSLVLSPLSESNTGMYYCIGSSTWTSYMLVVCPDFGPPVIEHFSVGDVVALRCNHSLGRDVRPIWFMRTAQAEDTVVKVNQFYEERSSVNINLRNKVTMSVSYDYVVLSNVSVEDKGEYWCAVVDQNNQCILTAKTILKYRDPFWTHVTSYALRSLLLVIPCVVVLAVIHRTRRRERAFRHLREFHSFNESSHKINTGLL